MYSEAPGNLPGTTTVQTHEDALDAKHDPWCLVGLSLLSKRKKPPGRALVAFCKNVHTDKKHTGHRSFVYLFMRGYIAAFNDEPQLFRLVMNSQTNGSKTLSLQVDNFHDPLIIYSN